MLVVVFADGQQTAFVRSYPPFARVKFMFGYLQVTSQPGAIQTPPAEQEREAPRVVARQNEDVPERTTPGAHSPSAPYILGKRHAVVRLHASHANFECHFAPLVIP